MRFLLKLVHGKLHVKSEFTVQQEEKWGFPSSGLRTGFCIREYEVFFVEFFCFFVLESSIPCKWYERLAYMSLNENQAIM